MQEWIKYVSIQGDVDKQQNGRSVPFLKALWNGNWAIALFCEITEELMRADMWIKYFNTYLTNSKNVGSEICKLRAMFHERCCMGTIDL